MTLITILNHFISYLSKFINSPARNQETITFPEMIEVPYVSARVFYVWKHIVYPWVYHQNEPIKFPEIFVFKLDYPSSFSNGGYSSLVFKTKFRKFCKERRSARRERTQRDFRWQEPVSRWCSSLPFWSALSSESVFSYRSTGAWFRGVNRFNCLAYKEIFAVELLGLIASDTRTHTPGLRRPGQHSCQYLTHARRQSWTTSAHVQRRERSEI